MTTGIFSVIWPLARIVCCVITDEPVYNNLGLSDISSIASDILWLQLISHR